MKRTINPSTESVARGVPKRGEVTKLDTAGLGGLGGFALFVGCMVAAALTAAGLL